LDLRLLGIAPSDIDGIEIARGHETSGIAIRRQATGDFHLFKSSIDPAIAITQEAVSELLFALAELRGTRIAEKSEVTAETLQPSWTLRLVLASGGQASLRLGNADPEGDIYAIASGDGLPRGVGDQLLLVDTGIRTLIESSRWLEPTRGDEL
jgi:hypothetical protein